MTNRAPLAASGMRGCRRTDTQRISPAPGAGVPRMASVRLPPSRPPSEAHLGRIRTAALANRDRSARRGALPVRNLLLLVGCTRAHPRSCPRRARRAELDVREDTRRKETMVYDQAAFSARTSPTTTR